MFSRRAAQRAERRREERPPRIGDHRHGDQRRGQVHRRARGAVGARPHGHRHQHDVHRPEARHRDRPEQGGRGLPLGLARGRVDRRRGIARARRASRAPAAGRRPGSSRVTSTRRSVRLTRAAATSSRAASARSMAAMHWPQRTEGTESARRPRPSASTSHAGAQFRPPPPGKPLAGLEVGRPHVPATAQSVSPPPSSRTPSRARPRPDLRGLRQLRALPCPKSRPFGIPAGRSQGDHRRPAARGPAAGVFLRTALHLQRPTFGFQFQSNGR